MGEKQETRNSLDSEISGVKSFVEKEENTKKIEGFTAEEKTKVNDKNKEAEKDEIEEKKKDFTNSLEDFITKMNKVKDDEKKKDGGEDKDDEEKDDKKDDDE